MAETETKKRRQPRVIVFSTPTCPHCRSAKRYLKQKGVRFTDVDVSRDQRAARDMERISGQQGVPVITIGGRPIVGFDRNKIDQILGLS
ncbi:MAG: glutathione S-transferase N-terminal domain-containing protein [Anaerolineae bacterium]|nr:glutathione S-transferase N-terminal domain-containing protein [Anaerolineae bacterium]